MMAHTLFMSIYNTSFEQTVFLIGLSLAACFWKHTSNRSIIYEYNSVINNHKVDWIKMYRSCIALYWCLGELTGARKTKIEQHLGSDEKIKMPVVHPKSRVSNVAHWPSDSRLRHCHVPPDFPIKSTWTFSGYIINPCASCFSLTPRMSAQWDAFVHGEEKGNQFRVRAMFL